MTVVKHLWLFVELAAHAMSTEIAHHSITVFLAVLLDSMTDVAHKTVWLGSFSTDFEAFLGHSHQLLLLWSRLTDDKHTGSVGIIAVHDGSHIHIDDIALLEHVFLLRNTVANHLIDTRTNAFRIALVIEAGRYGIMILAILHTDVVDLLRVHTWADSFSHRIKTARIDDTALTDTLNLFWSLDQITSRHQFALIFPKHHLLIKVGQRLTRQAMPSSFFNNHFV